MPLFSKVIAGDYEGNTIMTVGKKTTIDLSLFKSNQLN